MLRFELESLLEAFSQSFERLSGHPEYQVYPDPFESRGYRRLYRRHGPRSVVPPPENNELCIVERLDADTDPVESALDIRLESFRIDIVGIDLDSDLRSRFEPLYA